MLRAASERNPLGRTAELVLHHEARHEPMRVGVIGFGKAGRQHADAVRRSGEAEL
ncbi:MAG: hypothetical protein K0Q89_308, partial [Thermomicrobiales bacterium]|nr:hypothetical protein [Thermomicrobiales bacterium]